MSDLFLIFTVPVIVLSVAGVIYWVENLGKCRHKWSRWDDPENTGMNVIQRRSCEKCNLQESRVMIANASIETFEERHDVAISPAPTDTVDTQTRA